MVSHGAEVIRIIQGSSDEEGVYNIVPLMRAAENGKLSIVKFLVAYGACINAVDRSGFTAFMVASVLDRKDIVAFLLMQPDLDICYRIKEESPLAGDWLSKTALEFALRRNGSAIAHMIRTNIDLIKRKILWLCSLCPPEGQSQQEQAEWLEKLKGNIKRCILQIHTIDIADENGNTPLHKAVIAGNNDLALWILSIQPSLMLRENKPTLRENESEEEVSGETPLHCDSGRGKGAEFIRKFIEGCIEEIQKGLKELEKKKAGRLND